jgi:L-fuconolactonase
MNNPVPWLERNMEAALEPELPICDPHHHLWDYPDSRYLVDEFLGEIKGGHRVVKTVFVECLQKYRADGPKALRPVGETEFIDRITRNCQSPQATTRVAAGIVGFADLTLGDEVEAVLEAHLEASPRFRGIRHATAWDASEQIHKTYTNPPKELLLDQKFRAGFACLGKLGLSFDAWLYHTQIDELGQLAEAFPDTRIILDHIGGPLSIGPYAGKRDEVFAEWQQRMARLAAHQNITVKLGGLTMKSNGFGWHRRDAPPSSAEIAETMKPYFHTCIDYFGSARCMFESNFPIDKVSCSYTTLWNAFKRVAQDYTAEERQALFHDTATRTYRLAP